MSELRTGDVAVRAEFRCEYCHAPERGFNFPFEVDHILPRARGGGNDGDNLALACRACNAFKGVAVAAIDPAAGDEAPLFHPRTDQWHEHFVVDEAALLIGGQTPVGRATVERLRINSAFQRRARRVWTRDGLFP